MFKTPNKTNQLLSTAKMCSRARTLVHPIPRHKTPNPFGSTHFSSSSAPEPNRDRTILARFHHKDWLTPKEATNLLNSLTHPSSSLTLFTLYSSRKDFNPTEPFCTSLITKLAHAQLLHPIQTLLQILKQHPQDPKRRRFSDDFFFTLIKLYAHVANRIDKAVETLFDMPNFQTWPTPRTFNFVLNVLVNSKLYDVVLEVYAAAPKLGVEVDTCCVNILIKGLCKRGMMDSAFEVFDEFPKLGLEPNGITFTTLMHGLCEKGMVEEAFGLLERMEKSGVCVDVVGFNVLIKGLRKKGRVEEGKEVLEMMMRRGCYPNEGSYQEILYGLIDARRFGEAKGIVERMWKEGFVPSFVAYKGLIVGFCEEGVVREVDWALRHMVRQGFVPTMGMWRRIVKCVVSRETSSTSVSFDRVLES